MKKAMKLISVAAAAAMILTSFTGCGSNGTESTNGGGKGAIKVGGIGPITGLRLFTVRLLKMLPR